MPIPPNLRPHLPPNQPPHRAQPKQYPIDRHARDPDVHKARREIISVRAQRAPAFAVAAEGLVLERGGRGGEVVAAIIEGLRGGGGGVDFWTSVEAADRAGGEDALRGHAGWLAGWLFGAGCQMPEVGVLPFFVCRYAR